MALLRVKRGHDDDAGQEIESAAYAAAVRLASDDVRERFRAERVARLATADAHGVPHVVPIVFAVDGAVLWSAVDHKPKSSERLQRLADIAANPAVSVLVDRYADDWSQLWWARADGTATVLDAGQAQHAIDLLAQRYAQYREHRPHGALIAVEVARWSGWSGAG